MSAGAGGGRLVLLRHAKAEPDAPTDALRPLALTGRRQAGQVGASLASSGLVPDLALVSSAVRTRQTWDLVRSALGGPEPEAEVSDRLYEAGTSDVLDMVRAVDPRVATLLVVGHEPTMSSLAATLAGPGSDDAAVATVRTGLSTGAYAVLEVPDWAGLEPRGATLTAAVRPAR
ncbi:SixA phosphatase family protein [Actinotalea solisilvae]|uniref:SixA phosphatase family protein n=1 Tax=Actinotalea solisilvae TaxID=2072922 RepID=UPI0018F23ADB|nr:histidine phosphatase family protein [Actinotalea solisilvae]